MKAKDLKNSILQMAVEGKLVPQDQNDEPASVLLERIREEKHKLIAEGKAKFPKGGESVIYIGSDGSPYEKRVDAKGRVVSDKCIASEVPFDKLPEGWALTRFQTVCLGSFTGPFGSTLHRSDYVDNGIPVINPANIYDGLILPTKMVSEDTRKRLSSYVLHSGDFIIGRRGEMGRAAIISAAEEGWLCGTGCFFSHTTSAIEKPFWKLYFDSSAVINQLEANAVGTTMKNLNLTILDSLLFPLPPLAEQRRIVERVNELMPLVEEYGELEDAREALDAALPGRLRKSVLQLAVRGGLVPQDPADEPAGVLLERIRGQRRQLVAEGKMKAPKGGESIIFARSDGRRYEKRIDAKGRESEPACIEDEIPFEIPDSWEWVRLEGIGDWKAGATPAKSKPEYYANGTIPWLLTGDLNDGIINEIPNSITEQALEECSVRLNPAGSVLIAMYGATIGRIGVLGVPATTNQACCACILHDDAIKEWLTTWLLSYKPHFVKLGMGGAQPNISRGVIVSRILPLPPLAEQRRIVERVRKILSIIG